ncbi:BlaI/MecI/CopY family transcriptional regulator [Streptomyces arenae]|nr:BlaI/MecI/CopY family transcriptional regulator [Streptomyces arenae]MCG7206634.1 BlaI/MecI/CopY family transcriptional regulator [Streptomyces arenae]
MAEPHPRGRRRAQGALETQVLPALHQAEGPVTATRVQDRLPADLAYTTVMTVPARLLTKNAVTRKREGRLFVWIPSPGEAGLAALKTRRVLDGEQDRRAVLAGFITSCRLGRTHRSLPGWSDQLPPGRRGSGLRAVRVGRAGSGGPGRRGGRRCAGHRRRRTVPGVQALGPRSR